MADEIFSYGSFLTEDPEPKEPESNEQDSFTYGSFLTEAAEPETTENLSSVPPVIDEPLASYAPPTPQQSVLYSYSNERDSLLRQAEDPKYDDLTRSEFLKSYLSNLSAEASGDTGLRPSDQSFYEQRKKMYDQFDRETTAGGSTLPPRFRSAQGSRGYAQSWEEARDQSEQAEDRGLFPYETQKEYIRRVFQEEVAQSNLTTEQKKKAFKELSLFLNELEKAEEESSPSGVLKSLVYDTSKIKTGDSDVGDVVKVAGGVLNIPGGLTGVLISSGLAPFLSEKYYKAGERPLEPLQNYKLLRNNAVDLMNWRNSGQSSNPDRVVEDYLSNGRLEGNDINFKRAAEISVRGKRLSDTSSTTVLPFIDVSPGEERNPLQVPFYSTSDVINITNTIADNEEYIKEKISNLLVEDPNFAPVPAAYEGFVSPLVKESYSRDSKKFKDKVNQIYNDMAGVFFAESEVYDELSDENKRYADTFKEFFPTETESSKAYSTINEAKTHVFGKFDNEKAFDEFLSVVPEEQRNVVKSILTDSSVGAAFTGGLHKKQADKRSIFNAVAVRYAQRQESQQIKELAKQGGLGEGWRGDHITDPERKKRLHEFAHTGLLLETIAAMPEFEDSAESYFSNVGYGLAELPHQVDVSIDYLRYVFGDESLSKEEISEAKAKWSRDPVIVLADLAAALSLGAKAAKAGAAEIGAMKDALRNVKGQTFAATGEQFKLNSFDSLKQVAREYVDTRKNAAEILEESAYFPEDTFVERPMLTDGVDTSVDLKGVVVRSPETTVSAINDKLFSTKINLQAELQKPKASQDQAKIAELKALKSSYERLILARKSFVSPGEEVPLSVKGTSTDGSVTVPVSDASVASTEAVEGSFLQRKGTTPKDLTSLDSDTRFSKIESGTLTQFKTLQAAYRSDPDLYVKDMEVGQSKFDQLLRGRGVFDLFYNLRTSKNPATSYKAVESAIDILYETETDDPRVWSYLKSNSRGHLQDSDIAFYMSEIRDAKYSKGVSARQKVTSPLATIKMSTKRDYGVIDNEYESLTIGYELANAGITSPEAYIGLNLSNGQIASLIEIAKDVNKTAVTIEKISTGFNAIGDQIEYPIVELGGVKGAFVPRVNNTNTQPRFLPDTMSITEPLSLSERLSRIALKTLGSQKSLGYLRQYKNTGQFRYPLYVMAEMMQRPFAFANVPGWIKNGREELLLWAYTNDSPKLGSFLNMFAKDSEILGKDLFYELRAKQGELTAELNNILRPEEGFQITPSMIPRYFNRLSEAEKAGVLRDFNKSEIHEYGSVIHRMTDAKIKDPRTGKEYQVTEFLDRTADTSELNPIVERNYNKLKNTNERARYLITSNDRIARIDEDIRASLQESRRSVKDLLPYAQNAKENIEALTQKSMKGQLSREEANLFEFSKYLLESYEMIDSSQVLSSTKDIQYTPIRELDNFQRSVTIFANEFVKSRRDAIFDEVTQIVTGKDTVRMLFDNNSLQTVVVRNLPNGEIQVLEKFPPTQKGYSQAVAFKEKTGAGTSLKSADELFQDAYNRGENGPLPIKTIRAWERKSYDIIDEMSNYVSDYFDVKKTGQFIENEINNLSMGKFSSQANQERLARHLLSITDQGRALLQETGDDPIRALEKALKLKATEQVDVFGKPLSNSDRNFMTAITEKSFTPQALLEMYSDYQSSVSATLTNLIKTKHTLMLQSYLQSKGMIVNNSQFNSLDKSIQNQFVRAENLTVKGKNVLPSTLQGSYINKRVATYFQRHAAMQSAFQEAGSIKKLFRRAQNVSKTGLLLDPINNSIAVNLFGAVLTQAPLHGEVPFNPSYYKRTRDALKAYQNKEVITDERLLRIIKTHSDLDTSVRRDVVYTNQMSLFDDFVADLYEYAGNEKVISILNQLDEASRKGIFDQVIETLSLQKGKIGARTREFLDKIKLDSLDGAVDVRKDKIAWAIEQYGAMQDSFFTVYQYPDLVHKIAYQWQLEEMGYKPSAAYSHSMQTFVDYVDVAPYINFFRYGGSNIGGTAFSPFTSDFITFSAAQVGNFNNAITNYPIRAFLFAQLGAVNDKALEETLKLKMGIQRIRELTGDPTLQLVPGRMTQRSTGNEPGDERDYVGGALTFGGARFTGVPAPIGFIPGAEYLNLMPLLPFSPEQTVRMLPTKTEEFNDVDNFTGAISVILNNLGSPGNQALESQFKRETSVKAKRDIRKEAQELGILPYEETDQGFLKSGQLLRLFAQRYVPRFIRSLGSVVETATDVDLPLADKKYNSQIVGESVGISLKPFDFRSVPEFRTYAMKEQQRLSKVLADAKREMAEGKPVNDENLQKVQDRLEEISNDEVRIKYNLSEAQFDEWVFSLLDLTSKALTGQITPDEINKFRELQMP